MAMRRANGSGSITKIKGKNRRKPYRVRITVGWEVVEETGKVKQIIRDLGCYATQNEARAALQAYLGCPYDLAASQMTFSELYTMWFEEYQECLDGISSRRTIESAWRYCSTLYNMRIRDIRSYHLKECIRFGETVETRGSHKGEVKKASPCTQSRMKSVFNLMFDFAYERELVDRNYARAFNLDDKIEKAKKAAKRVNYEFTTDEIKQLWSSVGKINFADMILIGIYSGWRPQELAILKVADIDLGNDTMKGGLKTEAGKNRLVPIHKDIKSLIIARLNEAKELNSIYLFNDMEGQRGTHLTYDKYRGRFNKVMKHLNMNHHPHETRHTFYTVANRCGMPDIIRDRIVGHAGDSLAMTYDHQDIIDMHREMARLKFK